VLLWQILSKPPKPVRDLRPEIPPAIVRVIERAMERNRDDRFPSAMDFIQALAQARSEPFAEEAPRVPPPPETQRMEFDLASYEAELPISVALPPMAPAPAPPSRPSASKTGFEDIPTETSQLRDFSLSDEGEATTTLIKDDELTAVAKKAVLPEDIFASDETVKMDNPIPKSRRPVPKPRR
jgi:hypothetical protein